MEDIIVERFKDLSHLHSMWITDFESGITPPKGFQLQLDAVVVREAALAEMNYTSASLNSCRLEDCSFVSCVFAASELIQTALIKCTFDHCSFIGADLRDSDASDCSFLGCDFTRADLTDARLYSADCTGCIFDYAWLIRTDLRNVTLDGVRMNQSRIDHAKLFNRHRSHLAEFNQVTAGNIDFSEQGDGSVLLDWPETLKRLVL